MNLIEQNLAAQDNILAALTDAYAQTANVRKNVEEIVKRREMTISSLINSYDAYEDLLAKSSKGLEFYRKLEINVSKLLQRVKSTCKVQDEEREQILAQDNKNTTYEKTDTTIPSTYDQGRPRSGNGLKLKDYLNSRVESSTGYQNPYYNLYKGHVASMQMDSKSLTTDMGNKNVIQSSNTIPVSEIPSSTVKSQHYYPATYADYRTSSPYSYGTQTYYENPVANNILSQNYLPTTTSTTSVYQQPTLTTPTAGVSNSSVQYPSSSYLSNEQTLSTSTAQDKFHDVSSNYNVSNTALQYDAYQSPTSYNSYNITTPYIPNQEKVTVKSGTSETSTHVPQPVPQIPVSTIGVAAASGTALTDGQGQASYGIVQQAQQYDNQQKTTLNQEMFHSGQNATRSPQTMPTKDSTLTQNYSLPQTVHSDITYSQNYQNTTYYNPSAAELQTQRVPYTQAYDPAVVPPTQYMQSPQPSTSNQSIHSVPSTNEVSVSYSPNLHGVSPVQYSQQTGTEQSTQNYTDKTYAAYGTQVQMNTVTPNYPSTYQNYQHGATGGTPYEQTMLPGDHTSSTYAYNSSSSEMIQSHAKPTTVQSYSQSYQYSQQAPYSGYVQYPNYSQSQNYAYMQNAHGTNTMAYTYNPTNQAQGYTYVPQGAQTSQTLEATVSVTSSNITASSIYQQQETNARYTNAGNNAVVSQTPSSQYSQAYQSPTGNDTYYTTPYGLQMQGQGTLYSPMFFCVSKKLFCHFNIILFQLVR